MISVSEATRIIQQHLFVPGKEKIPLSAASGRVLAEPIKADRDLPPFNRATMDGIAIAIKQFKHGQRQFLIIGRQAAGEPKQRLNNTEHAIKIMTGAIVPDGCDAVIRYEDLKIEDNQASVLAATAEPWQNVHQQGADAVTGEELLQPGFRLSAGDVALLASVGISEVLVYKYPATALISTGNELIPVQDKPLQHQIRRSNTAALQAALHSINCPAQTFHLPDVAETMEAELATILQQFELIILSGGVSKGLFDYVPAVLRGLGITNHFHQVSQRPGKPLWFGSSSQHTVFALPGNPVSTFLCFYRYVLPWLQNSLHADNACRYAVLGEDFTFAPALTYFVQVQVKNEEGRLTAYPSPGGGSGDFVNLKDVTGFLELPQHQSHFRRGEVFPYFPFRD